MYSITLQNAGGDNVITSGDILGRINFAVPSESDGAAATYIASQIYAQAEGSFTSASNPAALILATSSSDSAPATGRLKVSSDGHLVPLVSGQYDLGSPNYHFRNIYADNIIGDYSGQLDGNLDLNNYDIVGTGNITIDGNATAEYFYGDLDGVVITECRNDTGSTIAEGTPVYVAGYYSSNGKPLVAPADCANATKMPAIGLLASELTTGSEGHVHVFGLAQNLPSAVTNGFSVGNTVYVDNGGGLTNVRPTGVSELVQNIGRVLKTGTNGRILVLGPGRSNDVPNSGHFEQLTVDGYTALAVDGGNVGIGTPSPETKLDVRSTIQAKAAGVKIQSVDSSVVVKQQAYSVGNIGILGTESNHNLEFRANNIGYMYLTTSGNVGIGTASPSSKLTVYDDNGVSSFRLESANSYTYSMIKHNSSTEWGYLEFNNDSSNRAFVQQNGSANNNYGGPNALSIYNYAGPIVFGTNTTTSYIERMSIDTAGNIVINEGGLNSDFRVEGSGDPNLLFTNASTDRVGIGTPSPSEKLDVNGGIGHVGWKTFRYTATTSGSGFTTSFDIKLNDDHGTTLNGLYYYKIRLTQTDTSVGGSTYLVWYNGSSWQFREVSVSSGSTTPLLTISGSKAIAYVNTFFYLDINCIIETYFAGAVTNLNFMGSDFHWQRSDNHLYYNDGNVTINDLGGTYDFRVKGDADEYLLYVKGSAGSDMIGIGTPSPSEKLHVVGNVFIDRSSTTTSKIDFKGFTAGFSINATDLDYIRLYSASAAHAGMGITASNFNIGTSGLINTSIYTNNNLMVRYFSTNITRHYCDQFFNTECYFAQGGSSTSPTLSVEGDSDTGFYFPSANIICASTAGLERVRINSAGNVGIGTASPEAKLHVFRDITYAGNGTAYAMYTDLNSAITSNGINYIIGHSIDARKNISTGVTDSGYIMGGDFVGVAEGGGTISDSYGIRTYAGMHTAGSGVVLNAYGVRSRVLNLGSGSITNGYGLYIDDVQATNGYGIYQIGSNDKNYFNGSVGIGTDSPSQFNASFNQLVVGGGSAYQGATIYSTTQGTLAFGDTATNLVDGYRGYLAYIHNTDYMLIGTAGAERVRITSDGKVGIGTASPSQKLHVFDDSVNNAQIIVDDGTVQVKLQAYSNVGAAGYVGTITDHDFILRTNNQDRIAIKNNSTYGGRVVVNPLNYNQDFQVKSENDDNVLYVDANNDKVGIGTPSPSQKLDIRYVGGGGMALIKSNDTNQGLLFGDMAYSANNAYQGIKHVAMTGIYDYMILSQGIDTFMSAKSNGIVYIRGGGNDVTNEIRVYPDTRGIVVNENGADSDFRVEGDADQNLLFVHASGDNVAVGTNTPLNTAKFQIHNAGSTAKFYSQLISGNNKGVGLLNNQSVIETLSSVNGFYSYMFPSTNGNVSSMYHFRADPPSGVGTVSDQAGFYAGDGLKYGTKNYGFYGNLPSATSNYNIYMGGSAKNYFNGNVGIGTLNPAVKLDVNGTFRANDVVTLGSGSVPLPRKPIELLNPTNIAELTINESYTFPTTDGSADQVLVTDGSGVLTWQDQSGAGTILNQTVNGRLTLESGEPVSSANQTAKTTLYFTPYKGNQIALYNGTAWGIYSFSELSLSLSGYTANTNYDIFIYDNSGTLTLESAGWTNDTTRATSLTIQDGVYVKSGATTRRYLGTIRITSTSGQCEDSEASRFVWNYYNKEVRTLISTVLSTSHTYATNSWRPYNNNTTNGEGRVSFVLGQADELNMTFNCQLKYGYAALSLDTTTAANMSSTIIHEGTNTGSLRASACATLNPAAGAHYVQIVEFGISATSTFYHTQQSSYIRG